MTAQIAGVRCPRKARRRSSTTTRPHSIGPMTDREPRVVNEADLPPPRYRQEQLEVANGRLRLVVIAVLIVMLAGFALLGIQFRQLNARIDQLATKVNGIEATFGVKFDETSANLATTNTKLDALSGRFAAEFKSLGAEIKAMEAQMATSTNAIAKSIAALRAGPLPAPTSLQPSPAPVQPSSTPTSKPASTPLQPPKTRP